MYDISQAAKLWYQIRFLLIKSTPKHFSTLEVWNFFLDQASFQPKTFVAFTSVVNFILLSQIFGFKVGFAVLKWFGPNVFANQFLMAVELTLEQLAVTSSRLSENEASRVINASVADTINTSHEYELNNSESLTFLYNLLYDDNSSLTKSDILSILNSLKERENNLPFSLTERKEYTNVQGVRLPPSLSRKFYLERSRIGNLSWFRNIPDSREHALNVSTTQDWFCYPPSVLTSFPECEHRVFQYENKLFPFQKLLFSLEKPHHSFPATIVGGLRGEYLKRYFLSIVLLSRSQPRGCHIRQFWNSHS